MGEAEDWEKLRAAAAKYRNWGKWGPDDQVGCLNYITPEMIASAATLVKKGKVFSLAIPFDINGPQLPGSRRFNPMLFMLRDGSDTLTNPSGFGGADDVIMMPTHGATHWDALSHVHWEGKVWNGYPASVVSSAGASKVGIETMKDKIAGRGVLLDVPRYKGVDWLPLAYAITPEDLDNTAAKQGVEIRTGDFVLVRTGTIARCRAQNSWGDAAGGACPGVSFSTCGWIYEKQVTAVASDTWGCEVRPNELDTGGQPWHRVLIPNTGTLVGEWFDLDALADDCAEDGRYEFMLIAPPLPFTGAVGTPVNPYAIK